MRFLENKANLLPLNLDECGVCSNPVTALTHLCTNCGSALCGDCAEDHACGDCNEPEGDEDSDVDGNGCDQNCPYCIGEACRLCPNSNQTGGCDHDSCDRHGWGQIFNR